MRRLFVVATTMCVFISALVTAPSAIRVIQAKAPALPAARAYSLGDSAIDQAWLPKRDANRHVPFRVEGVMAVPDGAGPFPVLFVLHDAHGGCSPDTTQQDIVTEQWPCLPAEERRSDIGLSYLLSNLAARGYAAVAPNLNVVYAHAFGAVTTDLRRYPSVFDAHLKALAAANLSDAPTLSQPQSIKGKLDLTRIGIIGHGQGSLLALDTARTHSQRPSGRRTVPTPSIQPVIGVLLVAPVYAAGGDIDVPLGVILPECDGITPDLNGQAYYEDARLNSTRAHFAASVYVLGANSRFFNNAVGGDDAQKVADVPGCDSEPMLLSRDAQRSFLSKYAADFFDVALGKHEAQARTGLDAAIPSATRLYDTPVLTDFAPPVTQRAIVVQPRNKEELSSNGAAGFSKAEGATRVDMCESRVVCGRWAVVPANPSMARLSWTSPTGAAWTSTLGDRDKPADLGRFASLHLRVAPDPSDGLNTQRTTIALRITLVDDRNKAMTVTLRSTDTPALAFSPGKPDATSFRWLGHAYLASVRVPLTQFDGIDLTRVTILKIEPTSGPSGSIFLADIEFLQP